ncbi:MAG: hypothetical protein ABS94_01750 [Variovorax sp. SCN 67-85]|nr:MAG: hypothetical protein ABS94_01750 [Variovorax sp. SCN 67-85]ODV23348.1 MAG: hypothetical protein ABT25_18730 [Variovorax sp. SCN 67-20]
MALPVSTAPTAPEGPTPHHSVSGTVSGLLGTGLVLQNNAGDDLVVAADGSFTFPTSVAKGGAYAVTVKAQPKILTRTCTVSQGSGTMADAAVTDVSVACAAPAARFAHVLNNDSTVSSYTIDAVSGALGTAFNSPTSMLGFPAGIAAHPSGRFVYVAGFSSGAVHAFSADTASGRLSQIGSGVAIPGGSARRIVVDPTGRFAYVAIAGSGSRLLTYAIDQVSGALSFSSSVAVGANPLGLTVDPMGRFVYVTSEIDDNVRAFAIDDTSGSLGAVSLVNTGPAPSPVAVDPAGRFAYVANRNADSLSSYPIDATSGALSAGGVSTVRTGRGPISIATDATGRFVYTADYSDGTVSGFTVDAASGALAPMTPSVVASNVNVPVSIVLDPTGRFVYVVQLGGDTVSVYGIDAMSGALNAKSSSRTGMVPLGIAFSR